MAFSFDSRWVAVSTLNGTTHVFPISPYGGDPTLRTHTASRVVNKMSRFRTSAGMDLISNQHPHDTTKNSPHAQLSQSPPPLGTGRDPAPNPSSSSHVPSYVNGYNSWSNPRSLPLPTPVSVTALQQIKQPYQSSSGVYCMHPRPHPLEGVTSFQGPWDLGTICHLISGGKWPQ